MRRVAVVCFVLLAACGSKTDKDKADTVTPTSAQNVPTTVPVFASSPISTPPSEQGELTKITVGDHDGFTRVVFTFADAVPGYSVKPATPPFVQDGSGKTVVVAGNGHLAVRLVARAHDDKGSSTVAGTVAGPNGSAVTQVVMTGDFEGVVNVVVGTAAKPPAFRTFTLSFPSRLVLDVSDRNGYARAMSLPRIASRAEWTSARRALLEKEKAFTRQRDALNVERRELPMVEVEKDYVFDGPDGEVHLRDLFEGRRQLIVYHFMFHPEWDEGCPSCTAGTDELNAGFIEHLHTRDTSYAMVSRAPLAKLAAWKAKRGWDLPWYSSGDSDFNYDFGVTIDASRGFDEYNFRTLDDYAAMGQESMKTSDQPYDMPGRSCFLQADGRIFHTYSVYARGLESTGGSYYFLDLTALGRQEDWEEPKGRADAARGNIPDFAS